MNEPTTLELRTGRCVCGGTVTGHWRESVVARPELMGSSVERTLVDFHCTRCGLLYAFVPAEAPASPAPARASYRCEYGDCCESVFVHPDDEDCELKDGHCAHLMRAGWRPVHVRVEVQQRDVRRPFAPGKQVWVFSRGGWLCPEHAPAIEQALTAARKRRRRRSKK